MALKEIGIAVIAGAAVGALGGLLVHRAERHGWTTRRFRTDQHPRAGAGLVFLFARVGRQRLHRGVRRRPRIWSEHPGAASPSRPSSRRRWVPSSRYWSGGCLAPHWSHRDAEADGPADADPLRAAQPDGRADAARCHRAKGHGPAPRYGRVDGLVWTRAGLPRWYSQLSPTSSSARPRVRPTCCFRLRHGRSC